MTATAKYQHPDAKGSIEVRKDFAEMYESQGWTKVEEKSSSSPDPKK